MTDPLDKLAEWREVTDKATEGPWGANFFDVLRVGTQDRVADVEVMSNAAFISASRTAMPALLTAVENVLKLHGEFRIYDECECVNPGPEGHVDVYEVGRTCNHIYSICRGCCTDDGYQREDCANYHDHTVLDWECPTATAIRDAIGGAQ